MTEEATDKIINLYQWWESKRLAYNIGLIKAGGIAFILYAILSSFLIAPFDNQFEITLLTVGIQGLAYLLLMILANGLYYFGYFADQLFNNNNTQQFRAHLYNFGYWFSFALPFSIPLLVIISYFMKFH